MPSVVASPDLERLEVYRAVVPFSFPHFVWDAALWQKFPNFNTSATLETNIGRQVSKPAYLLQELLPRLSFCIYTK